MKIRHHSDFHQRVCYYPSCHHTTPWILMGLDCDLYIMSDKVPGNTRWHDFERSFTRHGLPLERLSESDDALCLRSGGKTIWVFREDNRETLARIAAQGLKIDHFVGICDGCREGGNYECVHDRPFLSLLLPLAQNGMLYTTDHSEVLLKPWNPGVAHRKFVQSIRWQDMQRSNPGSEDPSHFTAHIPHDLVFQLQAVLIRKETDFMVLPFSKGFSELIKFKAFRGSYNRGILAEYHITWDGLGVM